MGADTADLRQVPEVPVVFLLDVDNTLLDNDAVIVDLKQYLAQHWSAAQQARYWAIFEAMRAALGYADYLGALQRYRGENPHDPNFAQISAYLLGYPFASRVFPGALALLEALSAWGTTVILSDGDVVFQPRKIERSGLAAAVHGRVLIYTHKETELADVEHRFPARQYVLIDDKPRILAAVKAAWGTRLTTVLPRQGHYAHDAAALAQYAPPDMCVDTIADLLRANWRSMLDRPAVSAAPRKKVLVIDVGGSHVKVLASGHKKPRAFVSGPTLTPQQMVAGVLQSVADWEYDVVTIGYPGPVLHNAPLADPHNLGLGWVGFNYQDAFKRPVKLMNDAAMQAFGSYRGGKLLFLGLGTGLGSAMIVNGIVEPMEIGHLPYKKGTYEDYLGLRGKKRLGKKKWQHHVHNVVKRLIDALEPDDVVIGGGDVKALQEMPAGARAGDNANAFRGGFRLWKPRRTR